MSLPIKRAGRKLQPAMTVRSPAARVRWTHASRRPEFRLRVAVVWSTGQPGDVVGRLPARLRHHLRRSLLGAAAALREPARRNEIVAAEPALNGGNGDRVAAQLDQLRQEVAALRALIIATD